MSTQLSTTPQPLEDINVLVHDDETIDSGGKLMRLTMEIHLEIREAGEKQAAGQLPWHHSETLNLVQHAIDCDHMALIVITCH